jgi:acetoin utilization deacetylase AcuC-like enzyme
VLNYRWLHSEKADAHAVDEFGPRCLIVSAGFDIAEGDPVGGFSVTTEL